MKKCHMASLMKVTFLPLFTPYDAPIIGLDNPDDGHTWE